MRRLLPLLFLCLMLVAALAVADQRHWVTPGGSALVESNSERHYVLPNGMALRETLTAAAPAARRVWVVGP